MSLISQVQTQDIYHGLPVYPPELDNLTAIITGANGISGHYMLRVLAASPQRWKRIFCLSRRPPAAAPEGLPSNATHIPLDFFREPEEIAQVLREHGVTADYVFFFSYVQPKPKDGKGLWSDVDEMVRLNVALLSNFLAALPLSSITPRRIMLQTGAKNYGGHLGPTKQPSVESEPRIPPDQFEPNFYYNQEDVLWAHCGAHPATSWAVVMPGPILGAVPDAAMNFAFPLAIYATVCQKLAEPFDFPGDIDSWQAAQSISSAHLDAYFEEYVTLSPRTANQRFNICDASSFTWEYGWSKIAQWYGIRPRGPESDGPDIHYDVKTSLYDPPPRGYGPRYRIRSKFTLVAWAKKPAVVAAWNELATHHELADQYRDLAGPAMDAEKLFAFLDRTLCRGAPLNLSMDKARKFGWYGFVSSVESLLTVFDRLAQLRMIPPVPKVEVHFD